LKEQCNTLLAQLWHHSRPKKAAMLMWLILHKGLLVGMWLVQMGLDGVCKICETGASETHEHYLRNCWMEKYAWNAFEEIWRLWGRI
jgi:hypothetical protein